jgi:hypothetical protein
LGAVVSESPIPDLGREVKTQLKQLVDQRLTGKITQEEFERLRSELLERL